MLKVEHGFLYIDNGAALKKAALAINITSTAPCYQRLIVFLRLYRLQDEPAKNPSITSVIICHRDRGRTCNIY